MNKSFSPLAEQRLLNLTVEEAKAMLTNNTANAFRTSQFAPATTFVGTPQTSIDKSLRAPTSYTPTPIVPAGYNINLDPTYSGTIGADTGYTGTPQTFGNVGPSTVDGKGAGWSGGISGGTAYTPYKSLAQQADEYAKGIVPLPNPNMKGYAEAMQAYQIGIANAKDEFIRSKQIEQTNQLNEQARQVRGMQSSAAGAQNSQDQTQTTTPKTLGTPNASGDTATSFANKNLTKRLGAITDERQAFIQQKRSEGLSDTQIRDLLASGQGPSAPVSQATTPTPTNATTTPEPSTAATTTGGTSSTTTPASTTTSTTSPGSSTETTTPPVPVTPQQKIDSNYIRTVANTETEPLTKASFLAYADYLDTLGGVQAPMSYEQFKQGAGASIAADYNATGTILSGMMSYTKQQQQEQKTFLQDQYTRNEQYNALQQDNIKNQLQYQNDRAVRDQAETNKKTLDQKSIMLALRGGFGSIDGNNEIAEARMKGEQAIIDLNKEFGFKMTDVSLQFTQLHNQAYDNFTQNWLKTNDDFYTRIANLSLQGISNETAKNTAVKSAYKDYTTSIADHNKELAKGLMDATKFVSDEHNKLRDDKRAQETLGWTRMEWASKVFPAGTAPQGLIDELQKQLPGVDVKGTLSTMTLAQMKQKQGEIGTSSSDFKDPVQASIMDGANLAAQGMSGTEDERAAFKQDIARKLRVGDTEGAKSYMYATIANKLKGTALTEYDARSAQVNQINSILSRMDASPNFNYSAAEYYKQKALAVIGQASPEYYSLMAPIAQLSAEITHGLSGAAVSPSEWSRLQKFMPATGEGKAVLKEKLTNLLKEAAWQNEAKLARAANLPVPADPFLPKGQQSQDTPKQNYVPSNESIHDTLAPAQGKPLSYISNFRVTQDYGSTWDQEHGFMTGPHLALDLAPKVKGELTHVPALRGGKVVAVNNIKGLGNSVTIQDEDGNSFIYGHLASETVKPGDIVDNDSALGIMGNTGSTDGGIHLHLAVKDKNGNYVDPRNYLT